MTGPWATSRPSGPVTEIPSPTGSECSDSRITTVRGASVEPRAGGRCRAGEPRVSGGGSGEHAGERDDDEGARRAAVSCGRFGRAGPGRRGIRTALGVMRITRPAASSEISPAVMKADW